MRSRPGGRCLIGITTVGLCFVTQSEVAADNAPAATPWAPRPDSLLCYLWVLLRSAPGLKIQFARAPRAASAVLAAGWITIVGYAAEWPEFRGPTGQGQATETGLPVHWSESINVVWKTPVEGLGWSSPVIRGENIWMTTATDEGRSLRAVSFDKSSGRLLRDIEIFRQDEPGKAHQKNSHATPTPILEGDRVYVHFGTQGTAALSNSTGEVIWRNEELRYAPGHGQGGSPALSGNLLVISCDGTDRQFVVALDKNTGKIRWRTDRRDARMAFSTPLIIRAEGRDQVVSVGADVTAGYDLETGEELWYIRYEGFSNVPRPVYGHGLVYIASGFYKPVLFAVRPTGRGDVTRSHVVWSSSRGVPLTSSPLLVGDQIYFVSDQGIASCLDAKSGEIHWRSRLKGNYSASPLLADGRIYFQNEEGLTTVIEPGLRFKKLAENQVDGRTFATIAPSDEALFLRTDSRLYRIEERGK